MNLALFDLDGTITRRDTMMEFIVYARGRLRFYTGLFVLAPVFLRYFTGNISNHLLKEKFLAYYFRGWTAEQLKQTGKDFSLNRLPGLVKKSALEKIREHRENGDRVVVVSASMACWLSGWCASQNLELISTQLDFKDGKFTGKFLKPNCHGAEKVRRIRSEINLEDFDTIYAYGDSSGDREMLTLADEAFFRNFKD